MDDRQAPSSGSGRRHSGTRTRPTLRGVCRSARIASTPGAQLLAGHEVGGVGGTRHAEAGAGVRRLRRSGIGEGRLPSAATIKDRTPQGGVLRSPEYAGTRGGRASTPFDFRAIFAQPGRREGRGHGADTRAPAGRPGGHPDLHRSARLARRPRREIGRALGLSSVATVHAISVSHLAGRARAWCAGCGTRTGPST